MTERAKLTITYKRLREISTGFQALKERKLPSLNVELRVAAQFKHLLPIIETYQEVRKKVIKEHELPEGDAAQEVRIKNQLQLRDKLDALDAETVEIYAPVKKLTKVDLPQVFKGEGGEQNALGNAGIVLALAPEFFDLPDEEAE